MKIKIKIMGMMKIMKSSLSSGEKELYNRLIDRSNEIEDKKRQGKDFKEFHKTYKKEIEELEKLKLKKDQEILNSGKSKIIYAIDLLIEKSLFDCYKFEVSYCDLGFLGSEFKKGIFLSDGYNEEIFPNHLIFAKGVSEAFKFLNKLKKESCFEKISKKNGTFLIYKPSVENLKKFKKKISEILEEKEEIQNNNKQGKIENEPIAIKNIRLNKENYLIEINNGEKIISFRSKKKNGITIETKLFKILFHLWDFRKEIKGAKVLEKGDHVLLKNIKIGSECPTTQAVYQHIKRLNNRFKKENLPVEIKGKDEKYRLIINIT